MGTHHASPAHDFPCGRSCRAYEKHPCLFGPSGGARVEAAASESPRATPDKHGRSCSHSPRATKRSRKVSAEDLRRHKESVDYQTARDRFQKWNANAVVTMLRHREKLMCISGRESLDRHAVVQARGNSSNPRSPCAHANNDARHPSLLACPNRCHHYTRLPSRCSASIRQCW